MGWLYLVYYMMYYAKLQDIFMSLSDPRVSDLQRFLLLDPLL